MLYAVLLGSLLHASALKPPDQERWMQQLPQTLSLRELSELQLQHQEKWPFQSYKSLDGVTVKVIDFFVDPEFGTGNFTMFTGECTEPFEYGFKTCKQHWGHDWIGNLYIGQKKPMKHGAKFSMKTSGAGLGILSVLQLPETSNQCDVCGGVCKWPITAMAGTPMLPTVEDIGKLPIVGMPAAAIARQMHVPENKKELSEMISTPLEQFARSTGYWSQDELAGEIVTVGETTVDMKMMKCPLTWGSSPVRIEARFPSTKLIIDGGNFGWKVRGLTNMIGSMQMEMFTEANLKDDTGKEVFRMKLQQCMNCDP